MVELERARDRTAFGDGEMPGSVMPHEHEALLEVERVELRVGAAGAEPVEQQHREVRLQVALAGRRHTAGGEQRVADDQAGRDPLGDVAADAAVVVRQPVELEVLDEPVEPDGDTRRPLEDLGRDLGRDRIDAGIGEVEGGADLLALALDRLGVGRLDALDEVVDLQHLDVRARLRVHLREVGVQVEHPRIRVTEEADARGPQAVHGVGGVQPFAQHVPCRVAVEKRPRHRSVRDARARECACDLRDAARRAVGEPLACRHGFVVERARRLKIEDDDRRIDGLHDRKHLRRRRIGRRVEHDEVDARRGERRAGLSRGLRRIHQPGRDDLCAHRLETRFDPTLIALEPLAQALELRPVRGEPDAEDADARLSVPTHRPSAWARRRRAVGPQRCAAARERADTDRRRSERSRSRGEDRLPRCSGPAPQ